MSSEPITVAVIGPNKEEREALRTEVEETGLALVEVEVEGYCLGRSDRTTRQVVEAIPEVALIDMQVPESGLQTLNLLHGLLPATWLFVCSDADDSNLIIEAMRAGAREFLRKPVSSRTLAEAFGRCLVHRQRDSQPVQIGQLFCVTSAKGGSGATSVAINLAASLAEISKGRVALVDLNAPLGDAAAYLNLKPKFTVSDALSSASRLDSMLLETYMSQCDGIAVLPGLREFRPGRPPDPDALHRVLEVVAETYPYAVLDAPSSLEGEQLRALSELCKAVLVVSTAELPALWRTERLLRYLSKIGDGTKVRLVVNRWTRGQEISNQDIEKALSQPIFWQLPNNYSASILAINRGRPLVSMNHSELASSYQDLAHRLSGIPLPEKARGLLRFFSREAN